MVFTIPIAFLALNSLRFREAPDPAQFKRGVEIFVKGKGVERCWMEDRQVIGNWFDGTRHHATEEAIWLSPALMARWNGYLAAKEKWSAEQISERWNAVNHILDGKISMVVRLSAYPKRKLFDEDGEKPDLSAIDQIRFLITIDGKELPRRESQDYLVKANPFFKRKISSDWNVKGIAPNAYLLTELRGREKSDVEPFPWYQRSPIAEAMAPEFLAPEPKGFEGLFGDFHCRWFWVEIPIESLPAKQFELRVFSSGKERIGTFHLLPRRG
jgi:hypothetical protein